MYEVFARLLEERGVKTADVAKATGITPSTFSDWKKGKSSPKQEKLQRIADFFGVSIEYLLTGESEEYYIDKRTAALAQEIFDRPDLRILMDAARGCSSESITALIPLIQKLKETNPNA